MPTLTIRPEQTAPLHASGWDYSGEELTTLIISTADDNVITQNSEDCDLVLDMVTSGLTSNDSITSVQAYAKAVAGRTGSSQATLAILDGNNNNAALTSDSLDLGEEVTTQGGTIFTGITSLSQLDNLKIQFDPNPSGTTLYELYIKIIYTEVTMGPSYITLSNGLIKITEGRITI